MDVDFEIRLDMKGIMRGLPSDTLVGNYSLHPAAGGYELMLHADVGAQTVRTYPAGTEPEQILIDAKQDIKERRESAAQFKKAGGKQ